MKVKQLGTNIMATIFVQGTIHHYLNLRQTRTNSMTIIFTIYKYIINIINIYLYNHKYTGM